MSTKKKLRVSNHQLRAKVKELETALRVIRMLVGTDAINDYDPRGNK